MKNDIATTFLNLVLAVLVIFGVIFAVMSMRRAGELRGLGPTAMQVNSKVMMIQSLITEVNNFNTQAKSPEITRMLQTLQAKPAAAK